VNAIIWAVLLLVYGMLCGCLGAVVCAWARRRPDAGFLDPAMVAAMNALRAGHSAEFIRLLNAETARLAGRDGDPS
jgi:hypothetical protein